MRKSRLDYMYRSSDWGVRGRRGSLVYQRDGGEGSLRLERLTREELKRGFDWTTGLYSSSEIMHYGMHYEVNNGLGLYLLTY